MAHEEPGRFQQDCRASAALLSLWWRTWWWETTGAARRGIDIRGAAYSGNWECAGGFSRVHGAALVRCCAGMWSEGVGCRAAPPPTCAACCAALSDVCLLGCSQPGASAWLQAGRLPWNISVQPISCSCSTCAECLSVKIARQALVGTPQPNCGMILQERRQGSALVAVRTGELCCSRPS